MSKTYFLSTSVSEFINFLKGEPVADYGDPKETLDALSSFLYNSLRQRYAEFLSIRMKSLQHLTESESIQDVDIVKFLIGVFPSILDMAQRGPLWDMFIRLGERPASILFQLLTCYQESELDTLVNPSSKASQFQRFSQSSIFKPLYQLLRDGCEFRYNIDHENVVQTCHEIKDAILHDLMEYLRRLSIDEQKETQRNLKRSPPGAEGPNQQNSTSQNIQQSEWFLAWEDEFRGSALESLEVKLSLNVQALRTGQPDKISMSRIIPIVQSSGTGKSRLAEQYVNRQVAWLMIDMSKRISVYF
jgi:hypothetical protein